MKNSALQKTAIVSFFQRKTRLTAYSANPMPLFVEQKEKTLPTRSSVSISSVKNLFLSFFQVVFVTVHELVYTTGSVDQFDFTRVERM